MVIVLGEPCSLASMTTLGVGGPADRVVSVSSEEDAVSCLRHAGNSGCPVAWIGSGSNLLVHDRGFPGLVVRIGRGLSKTIVTASNVVAQAGVPLAYLVRLCCQEGLIDLSRCAGIPGSLGGAITMNAGTSRGSIGDLVEWVEILDPTSFALNRYTSSEMAFGYRSSRVQHERGIVVRAALRRHHGTPGAWWAQALDQIRERRRCQPQRFKSAGCAFRNPPGSAAGKLIEEAGLVGLCVGGAMVAHEHANFLVNRGDATCGDFIRLIRLVRRHVWMDQGVQLELELVPLGFTADELDLLKGDPT